MKYVFTLLTLCLAALPAAYAQTTADFENLETGAAGFLNGSDGSAGFSSGNIFLPNSYNPMFMSWSGWAISSVTDTTTPGFTNQYSAIAGGGHEGSDNYAVTFASPSAVVHLTGEAAGAPVAGVYVTNSTYAYLSMLEGDSFAKQFGGESGDDPDFFRLTVKKYLGGELSTDSVDFFLADYRFEDNAQDYIIDEWTFIDLSSLGNADSLWFTLASTDIGTFGMNTPAYFCIDNLTTTDMPVNTQAVQRSEAKLQAFPNPASSEWHLRWEMDQPAQAKLWNMQGQLLASFTLEPGVQVLSAAALPPGGYLLQIEGQGGRLSKRLVKY